MIRYLETGLNAQEVSGLAHRLGRSLHDLLRIKEAAYKEHELSKTSSDEAILQAIVASPILLERPIVVVAKQARIGRPPEAVLDLLASAGL